MVRKIYLIIAISLIAAAISSGCISLSKTPEEADWDQAQKSFTIKSFENYLSLYPNGTYAASAETKIANLNNAEKQIPKSIVGMVTDVDSRSNEFTIETEDRESMKFHVNDDTVMDSSIGERKTIDGLNYGDIVTTQYVNLSKGYYLAKYSSIMVGVSYCECGDNDGRHRLVWNPPKTKKS